MISHISGKLVSKSPEKAVVDISGIGYGISIPLSTYYKLPDLNSTVTLLTLQFIKEESMQLYGFLTLLEKQLFLLLIGVAGIGPKLARNILSAADTNELMAIISNADVNRLKELPGIGKKIAERVIVELKDKVGAEFKDTRLKERMVSDPLIEDVVSALKNLGYKTKEAEDAALMAKKENKGAGFEMVFKSALKILSAR